jgi:hypothetical protein
LLPRDVGFCATLPHVCAFQSLAFPRCGRSLALVRKTLSFICQLLAAIGDSVPLVSDAISFGSKEFASF